MVRHEKDGHRFAITPPDRSGPFYVDGYPPYPTDVGARKACVAFLESEFGVVAAYESLAWWPTSIEPLIPPSLLN